MVRVDEAFEVRFKVNGLNFEVLVDFDLLQKFRRDPSSVSVYDVLADYKIFKNQRSGELVSERDIEKVFPGMSEEEVFKKILLDGECQIPTSYLNDLRKKKRDQVVSFIVENAINPQTKTKFTSSLVGSEVDKLHFNFDPFKNTEKQAYEVLSLLKKRMPISINEVLIKVKIPGQFAGAFYGDFRSFGQIMKEFYDSNGALNFEMKTTEGLIDKVLDFVRNKTKGEAEYFVER